MGEPEQVPGPEKQPGRDQWHQSGGGQWRGSGDDHWWHSDRADSVGWGLAFVWGALVLLATNTGFGERYAWWDAWSAFFIGAGIIT